MMKKDLQFMKLRLGGLLFGVLSLFYLSGIASAGGNLAFANEPVFNKSQNQEAFIDNKKNDATLRISWATSEEVDVTVTGTVTDIKGEPIPGVTVSVLGTTIGTATDLDGKYTLSVPEESTLVYSFIGYESQQIKVGDQSIINVTLTEDISSLEEVVVVGYGTQQKSHLTGSVGSIEMDQELSSRPIVEFGQAMYGKIAGVQVISNNGRPGGSSTIQIRGINSISANSSPLIVIDGIPLPNYDLNLINPADIESIEVLKDAASAAIYGSRGANGVVLVTTKSGTSGKAKVNVNYSYGLQETIDKIEVMNSSEYAEASIDAAQNGWMESGGDPNAPNTIEARGHYRYTWPTELENPQNLHNTDWQDLVFRVAPIHKIDMNISGGNENTNYLISGGYVNQEGIVINSDYKKYSLNLKVSSKVAEWAEIGGMVNLVYDHENEPFNRIVEWAVQYPAVFPVYGRNGYLGEPSTTPGFENYDAILFRAVNGHPLYRINDDIQHKRFNSLGNVFANIDLYPGLKFRTTLNYYYRRADNTNYQAVDHNMGPNYLTEGVMIVNQDTRFNYNWQNLLTYDKTFNDHQLSVLVGNEYFKDDFYGTSSQRRGYNNDLIPYLSGGQNIFQATDNATERVLISVFSRVNYNYAGKYLLSASYRRDGSSRFGPNNKWGAFPSLSLGWILSDEGFMKNLEQVSNLKFRASYGFTGNDQFADYRWIGSMSQGRIAFGNQLGASYYPSGFTNPDLEWERTQQLNLGVDLGLFDGRFSLEADYYTSTSDGLLLDVPVPAVTGFTNVFKNIGKLENKGIELNFNSHNLSGNFGWTTQLNFSSNQNKVLELGEDDAPMIYNAGFGMQSINMVGEPVYNFYGYQYAGVYINQQEVDADPASYDSAVPGDGRYEDINNDGILNSDDRTIIGNFAPEFSWGLTNNFTYKGFDLSFLFQGVQGSEVFDNNIHRSMQYHEGRNYYKEMVNRWRSEDDPGDGYHYKLTVDLDGLERTASSYWIVDGSYLRLKSLTLGYTFQSNLLERMKLGSARVYFNGLNLFTVKESPVFDPENFNGGAAEAQRRGVAHSPYPTAKVYSLGLNVGL
jgi:TonB-linked SusC/RagA family outer membrane protein